MESSAAKGTSSGWTFLDFWRMSSWKATPNRAMMVLGGMGWSERQSRDADSI